MRTLLFRLIGMFEVAGGLYGTITMLRRLLPLGSTHDSVLALIGLLVFGFVLVAGVLLLEGSEQGVQWSRWAQLLQLPLIATPVFSYALHSGAFVNVFATLQSTPRLGIDWHAGSQGFVLAVAGPAVSRLGLNLLALLSWLVLRLR
ncbi:hypothetical protein UU9_09587 [Rhodanobacter fulvus Jip2]|uniref:Uncharacterized protein n=1 Tax=Rhodanobacter fulvus Jip2 TaxID=1163408 RepID=I4VPY7_9GAMM|nr:hypothetical protein [Rhodanobacter fulvus]EIL89278.1 hypothetical protein UU9_09587 [Rhodanobacter fulvus Jip2]